MNLADNKETMRVVIEETPLDFEIEGNTFTGEDTVMLHEDTDLLKGKSYHAQGFAIFDLLSDEEFAILEKGFTQIIADFLKQGGHPVPNNFNLLHYHTFVDDATHLHIVKCIQQGLPMDTMPLGVTFLDEKISEILGFPVTSANPTLKHQTFSIRVVRPNRLTDNNPPHRDVWLDHLRNAVNIYLPVCGSDKNSALPILPGSHLWKESEIVRTREGAVINGVKYTVPCVVGSSYGLNMVRPNPALKQATLFSPYLIHGGGYNLNTDTTRVSLEMRFWKKND